MGEIADMHVDGTLCQHCGVVFDDIVNGEEAPGHPRSCEECAKKDHRTNGSLLSNETD